MWISHDLIYIVSFDRLGVDSVRKSKFAFERSSPIQCTVHL